MKKTYEKPLLYKESFEMADVISAACSLQVNHAQGQCGYDAGGGVMLFLDANGCNFYVPDGFNGICYNVPIATSQIFSS